MGSKMSKMSKMTTNLPTKTYNHLIEMAESESWAPGYALHLKKIKELQDVQRSLRKKPSLTQPTPKHLWMLTQIYGLGKENNDREVWGGAELLLLMEGFIINTLGDGRWGLQRIPTELPEFPGVTVEKISS